MPPFRHYLNLAISSLTISLDKADISLFNERLAANVPFSFARFGDGEWSAILGKSGGNCDGHRYTSGLSTSLVDCLANPKGYWYGMQPFALRTMGMEICPFLLKKKLRMHWYNASIMHDANIEGKLASFLRELCKKECVIIGPAYLRMLNEKVIPYAHFIEIPAQNCFEAFGSIRDAVATYGAGKKGVVYLFSASMAANGLIHELFDSLGTHNWLIDAGSLWDVYANVKSRSVYEDRDWAPILAQNLKVQE